MRERIKGLLSVISVVLMDKFNVVVDGFFQLQQQFKNVLKIVSKEKYLLKFLAFFWTFLLIV